MQTKSWDVFLQVGFLMALIVVVILLYFTRIVNIKADDNWKELASDQFKTAFEFEQEELKIQSKLQSLKIDYANDLTLYRLQLDKLNQAKGYSDLEKREKLKILTELYSQAYFERKQALIDQENLKLENLERLKCAKFCTGADLLGVQK